MGPILLSKDFPFSCFLHRDNGGWFNDENFPVGHYQKANKIQPFPAAQLNLVFI